MQVIISGFSACYGLSNVCTSGWSRDIDCRVPCASGYYYENVSAICRKCPDGLTTISQRGYSLEYCFDETSFCGYNYSVWILMIFHTARISQSPGQCRIFLFLPCRPSVEEADLSPSPRELINRVCGQLSLPRSAHRRLATNFGSLRWQRFDHLLTSTSCRLTLVRFSSDSTETAV